ncbi:Hsp20/alpha crystallin family protein [Rhizobium tibeticum]|uniref:Hsp20/alpha crystallin family protein n=1 Tax=Rhizobium tibeticum TaxID=501024 RepID=UPI0027D920FB|nr:Hsp20/alpha crystallin family protein [Rhizobium tibeticum]
MTNVSSAACTIFLLCPHQQTLTNVKDNTQGGDKLTSTQQEKAYHVSERHYGSFQRSFRPPDAIEADKVSAVFAKGVLKVTLPKSPTSKQNDR